MKISTYDSMGLKLNVSVPESPEEFDALAGKPGAVVVEAVNNVIYRDTLADFRSVFVDAIQAETGIIRKQEQVVSDGKPKVDEAGKPVMTFTESEGRYVARIRAELSLKADEYAAKFQPLANRVLAGIDLKDGQIVDNPTNAITFDPKAAEKKAKLPPQWARDLASQVLAKDPSATNAIAKLTAELGRPVTSAPTDLAWAIQEREVKRRAEANSDL